MRYTHAIVVRIPNSVKLDDKKTNVDFAVANKQLDDLSETLREVCLIYFICPIFDVDTLSFFIHFIVRNGY